MKKIIIYKSKYGSTQQYADWLEKILQTETISLEAVTRGKFLSNDILILGTPVYLGKMLIRDWIRQNITALRNKIVYLFVVSITPASDKVKTAKIIADNIPGSLRDHIQIFFLPGHLDPQNLSWLDKFVIRTKARQDPSATAVGSVSAERTVTVSNLDELIEAICLNIEIE